MYYWTGSFFGSEFQYSFFKEEEEEEKCMPSKYFEGSGKNWWIFP